MTALVPPSPVLSLPFRLARRWLLPLAILTLLGGLLGVVRMGMSLNEPFPGIVLLWRKEYKLLTVGWITPPYWEGPANGMRINDRILCINDYVPSPSSVVYGLDPRYAEYACAYRDMAMGYTAIFRKAYDSPNPRVDILIDREGQIMTIRDVQLTRFSPWQLLEVIAPTFLLGLALTGLGWVVYRANPNYEINLIFCFTMLGSSNLVFFQTMASHISEREFETGRLMVVQVIPWITFMGPMMLQLANQLSSPGALSATTRRILRPLYLLGGIFLVIGSFNFLFPDLPITQPLNWAYLSWMAGSWLFSTLWALGSLFWAYRWAAQRRVRMQAGLVLSALLFTTLMFIPFLGLFLFTKRLTFPYMQGLPYLALISVGLIGYAILRYQLFSARTQTLTALLVLVGSVIAAMIIYLPAGDQMGFVPLLSASLLAGSIFAGRLKPLNFLNRILHPTEQGYEVIARFNQRIRQLQSTEQLAVETTDILKDELESDQVDLWLQVAELSSLVRYCAGGSRETAPHHAELSAQITNLRWPVYAGSAEAQIFNRNLPGSAPVQTNGIWIPLSDHNQPIGLLYIGPRWTDEIFTEADLSLMALLAGEVSLCIANIRRLERMQSLQSLILLTEENERYKIARELHDTVLQFLLVLTFGLDGIKDKLPQAGEQVDEWQGRISAESSRLRDLLSYLRTPETLGQRGLITPLKLLLESMSSQTTTRLVWELDEKVEDVLSNQSKVALYRVVREAVYNALKHACARQITVRLNLTSERILFNIQDDGIGFNISLAAQDTGKGYSSVHDMRIYIESTGGELEINSTPDQGTNVRGWVPLPAIG